MRTFVLIECTWVNPELRNHVTWYEERDACFLSGNAKPPVYYNIRGGWMTLVGEPERGMGRRSVDGAYGPYYKILDRVQGEDLSFEDLDWRRTSFVSTEPTTSHTAAWFGPEATYYCAPSYELLLLHYVLKLPGERAAREAGWEFVLDAEATMAQTRRALETYGTEDTTP
jgi:hypothetical protein